ncbi:hypothetical protein CPT_Machias_056 [Staphylococcus phage Machias]|nr:hypothetical protein CPT_Machias_056 [Staphylococcus phage Machias]
MDNKNIDIKFNNLNNKKVKLNKNNKINNVLIKKDSNNNTILVNKQSKFQISSLYFEIESENSLKKFIKNVEGLVRRSNEYKKYLSILKEEYNLKNDIIMSNITEDMATTEYHHFPFTLYEIVEIVTNKAIMEDEQFTSIDIAERVLKLHFENKVGLVLLTKTNHQLAHAGKIIIPLSSIFGKVNEFVSYYKDYILDHQIEQYNELIEASDI